MFASFFTYWIRTPRKCALIAVRVVHAINSPNDELEDEDDAPPGPHH